MLGLGYLIVQVKVYVSVKGDVESAAIAKSSGNKFIDLTAVEEAKGSSYLPRIVECQPVESDGLFRADFAPN